MFTLALAVFFFFETAIAGVKSASVYAESDSSGTSTYFRAGTSVVSPVLSDGSATYTPGISERRNNNSTYYHSDLKNTTAQTASNEAVSGTNQYDAFGNVIDYSGNWNGPFAYGGAFGYQTDDDSGLMLLGHRYYDSSTGRFLSRDPIGDGSNWYAYCGNNPINRVDPRGEFLIVVGIIAAAVVVVGGYVTYKKLSDIGDAGNKNRKGFGGKIEEGGDEFEYEWWEDYNYNQQIMIQELQKIAEDEFNNNYGFWAIFQKFLRVRSAPVSEPVYESTPSKIKKPQFDGHPNFPLRGSGQKYVIE